MTEQDIIDNAKEFLHSHDAEVKQIGETYFLFLLWNKRSQGEWFSFDNLDKSIDFDYIHRQVVASGETLEKLADNLNFHVKLTKASKMDAWKLYLKKDGWEEEEITRFCTGIENAEKQLKGILK